MTLTPEDNKAIASAEAERERIDPTVAATDADIAFWGPHYGPEHLVTALIARIHATDGELEQLRKFAKEATVALTELVGGGSECFSKQVGEIYLADVPFCKERIKDTARKNHERLVSTVRDSKATRERTIRECAEKVRQTAKEFLSTGYAAIQPGGSILERFACEECEKAILSLLSEPTAEVETGWRDIASAPKDGKVYEISADGSVKVDGAIRPPYETDKGYLRVTLGSKSISVHRLVAMHFVPNPRGLKEINHKDGDKRNNAAPNLEWVTRSENMKHAYSLGLHPGVVLRGKDSPNWGRRGAKHSQSIPVRSTFKDGSIRDYESQGLAEADGFSSSKISECVRGKRKSHGGAIWMPLPTPPALMPEEGR